MRISSIAMLWRAFGIYLRGIPDRSLRFAVRQGPTRLERHDRQISRPHSPVHG